MNRGFAKLQLHKKEEACSDFNLAMKYGYKKAENYLIDNCN